MGDGLKITNEKRHRSSSSLAGVLEGVRSEKKIDVRASIPEVEDQFTKAEERCDVLLEKIDLIKTLKRKKKLKKRSMTTITEPIPPRDNVPLITIRTRPKKKMTHQADRFRKIEVPKLSNPRRGYVDPDLTEQHQMLNQVIGHRQTKKQNPKTKMRHNREMSDMNQPRYYFGEEERISQDMACGDDESSDDKMYEIPQHDCDQTKENNTKRIHDSRMTSKQQAMMSRRKLNPLSKTATNPIEPERRQVVELFNKNRQRTDPRHRQLDVNIAGAMRKKNDISLDEEEILPGPTTYSTKIKKTKFYNSKYDYRHYELPTMSSKMKQAGLRCYSGDANNVNIPFVVSKSTAPSHNVGVNLQQVLNGIKMKQPLSSSKIPQTIAYHMGLRHVSMFGSKSATMQPTSDSSEMNVIKLGQRTVPLPSHKYHMSYSRLLALYRAGNGYVSRFLRSVGRPHYFYTSMYDLSTNPEDLDAATSKGQGNQAKRSLAEYATLYRQYEEIERMLSENYDQKLEARKEELARKLAEREKHIRKLVGEYQPNPDVESRAMHASASAADEGLRHSTFKLHPTT